MEHWAEVVSELYQYVGMLRYYCQQELPKWIFDELQSIQEVSHRYSDEQAPEDLVETLAEELAPHFQTPPDRLLDGTALLFDYDPETIRNLVDTYFTPENARLDISSSMFGRSSDYDSIESESFDKDRLVLLDPAGFDDAGKLRLFDPVNAGPPSTEPIFGTRYWCQSLPESLLQEWSDLSKPQLPPPDSMLALPPQNPYVPARFDLKPLPPSDCHHPLLNCSIKLQISVGKKKVSVMPAYDCAQKLYLLHFSPAGLYLFVAMVPSNRYQIQ